MLDLETIILQYLLFNQEYFEKIILYLDTKLFASNSHKYIAKIIKKHFIDENERIPYDLLGVKIQNLQGSKEVIDEIISTYKKITKPDNNSIDSIIKETEKYFKQRKVWNVIEDGIEEQNNSKTLSTDYIAKVEEAVTFSFDNNICYNYADNILDRFKEYKENIIKTPTSIKLINDFTDGGVENKTINIIVSSTGGGKTVWLCQEAAFNLQAGKNVLYVTLEMSEKQISKRIDANLLNEDQDKLKTMSEEAVKFRFNKVMSKTQGQLYIKEFPADSITTLDIKRIMDQIQRTHKIKIDILFVDYLGIMSSYRYSTKNNSSYSIGKHTAEELRSLAVQYNIPVWTAIQFNRGAENPEDAKTIGLGQISDSYGIPMGADFMFAVLRTDSLDMENKVGFKILKNRYGEKKNSTGLFTVMQNFKMGRFENDPNALNIQIKNDSKTKSGKALEENLNKKQNNNTIDNINRDIFDNEEDYNT